MSKARVRHTRKRRRQAKAAMRNRAAKPTHRLTGGRTGSLHGKKLATRHRGKLPGLPANVAHVTLLPEDVAE